MYSEYDNRGVLYVDCTECERGCNGTEKNCSPGIRSKKPNQGGCFSGTLMEIYKPEKAD